MSADGAWQMPLKAVEVLVDETMLAALDDEALSKGMSRSAVVRGLVVDHVRRLDREADFAAE